MSHLKSTCNLGNRLTYWGPPQFLMFLVLVFQLIKLMAESTEQKTSCNPAERTNIPILVDVFGIFFLVISFSNSSPKLQFLEHSCIVHRQSA